MSNERWFACASNPWRRVTYCACLHPSMTFRTTYSDLIADLKVYAAYFEDNRHVGSLCRILVDTFVKYHIASALRTTHHSDLRFCLSHYHTDHRRGLNDTWKVCKTSIADFIKVMRWCFPTGRCYLYIASDCASPRLRSWHSIRGILVTTFWMLSQKRYHTLSPSSHWLNTVLMVVCASHSPPRVDCAAWRWPQSW